MKKNIPGILIAVVVLFGLWFFIHNKAEAPINSIPQPDWQKMSDPKSQISFEYPAELKTLYIQTDPQNWPPKVTIDKKTLVCEGGATTWQNGLPFSATWVPIHERKYCLEQISDGAAGTMYTTYIYSALFNAQVLHIEFTLRYPTCENYDEPMRAECKNELETFDINSIADRMIQSAELPRDNPQQTNGKSGPLAGQAGIKGTVMLGPTCPVMMDPPNPDCADKPYKTTLVLTTADQAKTVKQFSSDQNGKFTVEISPGSYQIHSAEAASILPYCASNEIIEVKKGEYTNIAVSCDTGIR